MNTIRMLRRTASFALLLAWSPTLAWAADPTTADCLSASEQAVKLHAQHRFRAMRQELLVCAASTCPAEVRLDCGQRVADVNRAMPTVVFEVRDPEGNELTGVSVKMDEEPLAGRLEGIALSLDPGEHHFVFSADGRPPLTQTLVLHEGEKDRRERVVLRAASPPSAGSVPVPMVASDLAPPPPERRSRIVPIVVGGVGGASIVAGAILGSESFSSWSASQAACMSATSCPNHATAVSERTSAETYAAASTALFIAGGALVGTAAVLWFYPRTKTQTNGLTVTPTVGLSGGGLVLSGGF